MNTSKKETLVESGLINITPEQAEMLGDKLAEALLSGDDTVYKEYDGLLTEIIDNALISKMTEIAKQFPYKEEVDIQIDGNK